MDINSNYQDRSIADYFDRCYLLIRLLWFFETVGLLLVYETSGLVSTGEVVIFNKD